MDGEWLHLMQKVILRRNPCVGIQVRSRDEYPAWDLKYSKATIIECSHTIDILRRSSDALLLPGLEEMKPQR